jgi:hypothetical protein
MFRSAAVEESNPVRIVNDAGAPAAGRCRFYGMCLSYAADHPYNGKPLCGDSHRGKRDYCGLGTPTWKVAPEGGD